MHVVLWVHVSIWNWFLLLWRLRFDIILQLRAVVDRMKQKQLNQNKIEVDFKRLEFNGYFEKQYELKIEIQ